MKVEERKMKIKPIDLLRMIYAILVKNGSAPVNKKDIESQLIKVKGAQNSGLIEELEITTDPSRHVKTGKGGTTRKRTSLDVSKQVLTTSKSKQKENNSKDREIGE